MKILRLDQSTVDLISKEIDSIPEKYQKHFNSTHEGLAVLREEYIELEHEIFFGEKTAKKDCEQIELNGMDAGDPKELHKNRIRKEAVQVAAMACRIIQELT